MSGIIENPNEIEGRDTDITQIIYSIEEKLKTYFPVNAVPEEIAVELAELKSIFENTEDRLNKFFELLEKHEDK